MLVYFMYSDQGEVVVQDYTEVFGTSLFVDG